MPKKNLLEDIKREPGRFYRSPSDVMRDRRFDDAERQEILRAWREQGDGEEVEQALRELAARHAAE